MRWRDLRLQPGQEGLQRKVQRAGSIQKGRNPRRAADRQRACWPSRNDRPTDDNEDYERQACADPALSNQKAAQSYCQEQDRHRPASSRDVLRQGGRREHTVRVAQVGDQILNCVRVVLEAITARVRRPMIWKRISGSTVATAACVRCGDLIAGNPADVFEHPYCSVRCAMNNGACPPTILCDQCWSLIVCRSASEASTRRFCSMSCIARHTSVVAAKARERACPRCGSMFNKTSKYCSMTCLYPRRACPVCGHAMKSNKNKTCSSKCSRAARGQLMINVFGVQVSSSDLAGMIGVHNSVVHSRVKLGLNPLRSHRRNRALAGDSK